MLRKKLESESVESESCTEIVDSGFLIIYEKPADFGSRIRIAIPEFDYSSSLAYKLSVWLCCKYFLAANWRYLENTATFSP